MLSLIRKRLNTGKKKKMKSKTPPDKLKSLSGIFNLEIRFIFGVQIEDLVINPVISIGHKNNSFHTT